MIAQIQSTVEDSDSLIAALEADKACWNSLTTADALEAIQALTIMILNDMLFGDICGDYPELAKPSKIAVFNLLAKAEGLSNRLDLVRYFSEML